MIDLRGVEKVYERGDGASVRALRELDLSIAAGEWVAVRGPSGSGKSTLLNILGCLDTATSGSYHLNGRDVARLDDRSLSRLRSLTIGFVFQSFNLLPRTTAVENVELPMAYAGQVVERRRALALLARVGLAERAHHYASELSGGEQQRVAIARAMVNDPPVVLADEPTGNLDGAAGATVMALLAELHAEGRTLVLVTHDDAVAAHAGRELTLRGGTLVADRLRTGDAATAPPAGATASRRTPGEFR